MIMTINHNQENKPMDSDARLLDFGDYPEIYTHGSGKRSSTHMDGNSMLK